MLSSRAIAMDGVGFPSRVLAMQGFAPLPAPAKPAVITGGGGPGPQFVFLPEDLAPPRPPPEPAPSPIAVQIRSVAPGQTDAARGQLLAIIPDETPAPPRIHSRVSGGSVTHPQTDAARASAIAAARIGAESVAQSASLRALCHRPRPPNPRSASREQALAARRNARHSVSRRKKSV